MNLDVSLSEQDVQRISDQVAASLFRQLVDKNPNAFRKHAYTVAEVSEQISYSAQLVQRFIREGRKDENGIYHKLPAKEITKGDYRILPADLDSWLAIF